MKVTVLGGSGFLGSHVADALTERGHTVVIFDREPSQWRKDNQKFVEGDITDLGQVVEAVAGSEVVYNFAALADIDESLDLPLETASVNVLGTVNALEASRRIGARRFVQASTLYVHSSAGGFYRCSKQAAESYVEEFERVYGLAFTILRFGSLYGPRSDRRNGLRDIIERAFETGVISYAGDPEATREYIHVSDAAKASVDILSDEFSNEHVVLTGLQSIKVDDLLKAIAEIIGQPASSIRFLVSTNRGHYVRTPYSLQRKTGKKFVPRSHVDLGAGLLELIDDVNRSPR